MSVAGVYEGLNTTFATPTHCTIELVTKAYGIPTMVFGMTYGRSYHWYPARGTTPYIVFNEYENGMNTWLKREVQEPLENRLI